MPPYIYYAVLSPPSLAVRVFAEASGASYILHNISVATGETRRSEYLKINPLGTVPFMKVAPGGPIVCCPIDT